MIIQGDRAAAGSGRTCTVVNPATGETVEGVPNGGAEAFHQYTEQKSVVHGLV